MKYPIRQFLVLTWVLLMSVFIAWSVARHRGLDAPVKPPMAHPFLESKDFEVIARAPADWTPQTGWTFHDQAAALGNSVILWIDVRPTFSGTLVVAREVAETENAPTLASALERFKQNRLILNFRGYREGIREKVVSVIESVPGTTERLLLQSPEDGFLKDLREAKPTWIFGTSQAELTRLIMLSSIGLESQSPIRGDIAITDDSGIMMRIKEAEVDEIHRRGRKFFAGPAQTAEHVAKLRERGFDGVITDHPELLVKTSAQPD
jgi:glycerophosphoryl diester phosphodiesterase